MENTGKKLFKPEYQSVGIPTEQIAELNLIIDHRNYKNRGSALEGKCTIAGMVREAIAHYLRDWKEKHAGNLPTPPAV